MDNQNEKWLRIFSCAQEILEIKPWERFSDIDLFEIRPYQKERVYVSFLGMQKEIYGVAFYTGSEVNNIQELSNLETIPFIQRLRYQKCIVCYFDKKEELSDEEIEKLESLNIKTKDKTKYIHFTVFDTKLSPYMIQEKELMFLDDIFPLLMKGLNRYCLRELNPNFNLFEVPVYSQTKQGNWSLSIKNFVTPYEPFSFFESSNYDIEELKEKDQIINIIELDIAYTNQRFLDSDQRECLVRIAMIADTETEMMVSHYVVQVDDDNSVVYVKEFIKYIENYGRPSLCVVRDIEAFEALFYLTKLLDINLVMHEDLYIIDDFVEGIQEFENKPFTNLS